MEGQNGLEHSQTGDFLAPTYRGTVSRFHHEHNERWATPAQWSILAISNPLNYAILIGCLMFRREPPSIVRGSAFLIILILSIASMQSSQEPSLVYGVLIGISSCWCIILSANLLFSFGPISRLKRRVNVAYEREVWEGLPLPLTRRFFWILDLLGSLRGLHWSYDMSSYSPGARPLKPRSREPTSLLHNLIKLLLIYLVIDCLKEIIVLDPYFWGYSDLDIPYTLRSHQFPQYVVQVYRMLICFIVIYAAIHLISCVGFLICVNIIGPSLLGPWGFGWAYQPQFGSFGALCTRGLQGFWGVWWHQMFRVTITFPAHAIVHACTVSEASAVAKGIRMIVPFILSGAIHACGSYTMWGPTKPLNTFLFFALQPLGMATQIVFAHALERFGIRRKVPTPLRQMTNVLFTILWLLKSFPLLADDFARGGLWLSEPFPISVLQLLGWGSEARSKPPWAIDPYIHNAA